MEPSFLLYSDSNIKRRPDIAISNGYSVVVTDVTIVAPESKPGKAAAEAAEKKRKLHTQATRESFGANRSVFVPFAVETNGYFDASCFKFAKEVATLLPRPAMRYACVRDMIGAASQAVARFRSTAVTNMLMRNVTGLENTLVSSFVSTLNKGR